MKNYLLILTLFMFLVQGIHAQNTEAIIQQIQNEATENSQLENLAHELMDVVGPRLVGTPQMKKAHDCRKTAKSGLLGKVERKGFEPSTSALRTPRSPN